MFNMRNVLDTTESDKQQLFDKYQITITSPQDCKVSYDYDMYRIRCKQWNVEPLPFDNNHNFYKHKEGWTYNGI